MTMVTALSRKGLLPARSTAAAIVAATMASSMTPQYHHSLVKITPVSRPLPSSPEAAFFLNAFNYITPPAQMKSGSLAESRSLPRNIIF